MPLLHHVRVAVLPHPVGILVRTAVDLYSNGAPWFRILYS